jgi:uncharacterized lipoprotein YajG
VLKFLSDNNIVTAAANTGMNNNTKIDVTITDHTNNGKSVKSLEDIVWM